MLVERERIARLEDVNSPEFSGPFKYVLKDMPMKSPKMPAVERARKRLTCKLAKTPRSRLRFEFA